MRRNSAMRARQPAYSSSLSFCWLPGRTRSGLSCRTASAASASPASVYLVSDCMDPPELDHQGCRLSARHNTIPARKIAVSLAGGVARESQCLVQAVTTPEDLVADGEAR